MRWAFGILVIATACGSVEEPPRVTVTPEAPVEANDTPAPEDARARAIRTAEAFVRAQGYADAPPSVPDDEIVHEGIEGTIADRRGTLDPTAVSARDEGGRWTVYFRYADPRYEDRGRALRLVEGETPHFVHQDVILSAIE
ncbi:MAG: hypothetical protein KC619_21325 [Myxococcales bacterium]|nr:hypothetical protein [Myxococcales bacterium]